VSGVTTKATKFRLLLEQEARSKKKIGSVFKPSYSICTGQLGFFFEHIIVALSNISMLLSIHSGPEHDFRVFDKTPYGSAILKLTAARGPTDRKPTHERCDVDYQSRVQIGMSAYVQCIGTYR
jgi:hypothetical protein